MSRRGLTTCFALAVAVSLATVATADDEAGARSGASARLEATVRWLASEENHGRGLWDDRVRVADEIAARLEALGFVPVPGRDSFLLDQQAPDGAPLRNVIAWLPATEADAGSDYVIFSAHYDHLPPATRTGPDGKPAAVIFPGADDNASGTAVLLEVAARLASEPQRRRALMVVAFDLEEKGLLGSRAFAATPPLPLDGCAAFLTMDQMGRSIADLAPGTLFLMGAEHSAELLADVEAVPGPAAGRKAILGIDFQPPTGYSDYVAFQERKIPFLFISSGACADYHTPEDLPDRVDYAQMARHADWVEALVRRLLSRAERPVWREEFEPRLEEIVIVRDIVAAALERLPELGVPEAMQKMVRSYHANLEKIIARGEVTAAERRSVRVAAQLLFTQAVGYARQGR